MCYIYKSVAKVVLDSQWFRLDERQKKLYRRIHYVISELNDSWYKSYAGIFSDDLICFVALLEFIDDLTTERPNGDGLISEEFNQYCIGCLQGRFDEMEEIKPRELI